MKHGKLPLWTMSAMSVSCWNVKQSMWNLSASPYQSSLFLASETANVEFVCCTCLHFWNSLCCICLPYLSALLASEEANVEFVCHIFQHCWQVKQLRYFSVTPVCTVGKWSSLCEIYLPYLSAVGTWSSLWNCLPNLSALLYVKQPVESVCHTCLHCWHVKQPVVHVCHTCLHCCHVKQPVDYVCHTCHHYRHVKQPMWYLSSIPVCILAREAVYVIIVIHTYLHFGT